MRRPPRLLPCGIPSDHHRRCNRLSSLLPLLLIPILTLSLLLFSRRRLSSPPSPSTADSPLPDPPALAYMISGTAGDGERVKRILQAAYHPWNQYVLHLDLAASVEERADLVRYVGSEAVFSEFGNVRVVEDADQVTEKGPTEVASLLHAVALLLREVKSWDWLVNLGASDYPLMSQDDILHIFSYLPRDLNFINHTSEIGWKESQRVRPIIVDPGLYGSNKTDVFWAKERRAVPSSFKLFVGSAWVVLTRSFLEFVIWGWDNLPRMLLMYYTNFLSAPESYFHSVICNSKDFQNTTVNHDLRFMKWDDPPRQQPATLAEEDFDLMVESGAPFAREFPKGSPLLDKIDQELLRRSTDRFTPGGWCLGKSVLGRDPCALRGNPSVIRPTASSARLESLLLKVLEQETFRSGQCT